MKGKLHQNIYFDMLFWHVIRKYGLESLRSLPIPQIMKEPKTFGHWFYGNTVSQYTAILFSGALLWLILLCQRFQRYTMCWIYYSKTIYKYEVGVLFCKHILHYFGKAFHETLKHGCSEFCPFCLKSINEWERHWFWEACLLSNSYQKDKKVTYFFTKIW